MTKRLFDGARGRTLDEQLEREAQLQSAATQTKDFREGVNAFLEKRDPRFSAALGAPRAHDEADLLGEPASLGADRGRLLQMHCRDRPGRPRLAACWAASLKSSSWSSKSSS